MQGVSKKLEFSKPLGRAEPRPWDPSPGPSPAQREVRNPQTPLGWVTLGLQSPASASASGSLVNPEDSGSSPEQQEAAKGSALGARGDGALGQLEPHSLTLL